MEMVGQLLRQLGWSEMSEVSWTELVARGVPSAMADLVCDVGQRTGRPIKVFTIPTLEAGIAGLAVPFLEDDSILFDPWLLEDAGNLAKVIVHELAHILHPSWNDPRPENYEEMERFASVLGPMLLCELPDTVNKTEPMVELALCNVLATQADPSSATTIQFEPATS
jgi:hypothetical protein